MIAKLKTFSPDMKRNFSLNKAKNEKKLFFVETLDQFRRLQVHEKARNLFVMNVCLTTRYYTTSHLHQVFSISLGFSLFFRSYFVLPNFWTLRNLIKQFFHSRLLDMRLVIANSVLCASLAMYIYAYPCAAM